MLPTAFNRDGIEVILWDVPVKRLVSGEANFYTPLRSFICEWQLTDEWPQRYVEI